MTQKEIVKRAIKFESPPRIGMKYNFTSEKSDLVFVGYGRDEKWHPQQPGEDEWGFVWDDLGGAVKSSLGQVTKPPLDSWDKLESYSTPSTDRNFDDVKETVKENPERYIIGSLGISGFNRMTCIRGCEELLEDMLTCPDMVKALAEKVFGFESKMIERFGEIGGIDAINWADDWGTQSALMISPKLWIELFKPLYQQQFDLARQYGMDICFHSCGYIFDIIPDLIDMTVDVLNLNQPRLLGIQRLGERFGGKVAFLCPVDMQTTIIQGTYEEIRVEARELIEALGKYKGGFLACADEGKDHSSTDPARIDYMTECFEEFAALTS